MARLRASRPLSRPLQMGRARRILAVTAGLVAFGGVAGAVAGALVALLVTAISLGPREALDLDLIGFGATLGAPLGAVLLPAAGWLLMRRVPLGRAMLWTTVGTIGGGLVGWFTPFRVDEFYRTLVCGFLGFIIAVITLRRLGVRRDGVTAQVADSSLA